MTPPAGPNIALYFDPDGYVEQLGPAAGRKGGPVGLMGRQVAGKEFLDAYLSFGRWDTLTAVVRTRDRVGPLLDICKAHPSSRGRPRRLGAVEERESGPAFAGPDPPARVLHSPHPTDARFAWARHAAGGAYALCGVTHTLSSETATAALCRLVDAPFEPHDALICTSRAVAALVRAVTGSYADYLRDRFGGSPAVRPRLEVIPLGVNPAKFRPPTADERATARGRFAVAADEVAVLCVGRLSHHAKAHPFPTYFAAAEAARRTGRPVHLLMAGWAANREIADGFRTAARAVAPPARVSFLDGQDPAVRAGVWAAADVVVSLPDNIQETFGLVVVEGMATGVPVVGSDWDGYKDLIIDGQTGYLVPTRAVRGAALSASGRLLSGALNYDYFLAECCQTVTVDPAAAADALTRLVADDRLRARMGAAGRERAVAHFAWEHVIRAYERLWEELGRAAVEAGPRPPAGEVRYPPMEVTFGGYPTAWVDDGSRVTTAAGGVSLDTLMALSVTNFVADRRCADRATLDDLLRAAADGRTVGELAATLAAGGLGAEAARATVAWLLKYGLLRCLGERGGVIPDRVES